MPNELPIRRVAVAGATGNAGKEILRAAKQRGLFVRALVRSPHKLQEARDFCDEIHTVEITDPVSLQGSLEGVDALISAIGKTFQRDATPRYLVDVTANKHLFAEAKHSNLRCIALLSVFMASTAHPVALLRYKGEAEEALKQTGLPYLIVQPSGFFSDMWEVFRMCERGVFWSVGDGTALFNPVSLIDLADFLVDRLLDPSAHNQTYPVGGPDIFPMRDLAKIAAKVLQKPVRVRQLPLWLCRLFVSLSRLAGRNAWELAQFFVGTVDYIQSHGNDGSTPSIGTHHLEDYFHQRYLKQNLRD